MGHKNLKNAAKNAFWVQNWCHFWRQNWGHLWSRFCGHGDLEKNPRPQSCETNFPPSGRKLGSQMTPKCGPKYPPRQTRRSGRLVTIGQNGMARARVIPFWPMRCYRSHFGSRYQKRRCARRSPMQFFAQGRIPARHFAFFVLFSL